MYNPENVNKFKRHWFALREKQRANKLQVALCDYHIARLNMLCGYPYIGLPFDFALHTVRIQRRRELLNP